MNFTIGNRTFTMPEPVRKGSDLPVYAVFHAAMDAANEFALKKRQIEVNNNLSNTGKKTALEPPISALWRQISASSKKVSSERQAADKRRADLYAVGVPATTAEAETEREIRQWWRDAPKEQRNLFREAMKTGTADQKILLALLRSPIPAAFDLEMAAIKAAHEASVLEQNRGAAATIKDAEDAADWAYRGMQHVIAFSYALTEMRPFDVLNMLVKAGDEAGAIAMGFTDADIAEQKARASTKTLTL